MKTNMVRLAVLASAMFTLTSCSSVVSPGEELASARSRWLQKGPSVYTMTIFRGCECLSEAVGLVSVTVNNGAISARYTASGVAVGKSYAALFPDVEGLFRLIADAQAQHYYKVDVEYDPELGFPTSISIDAVKNALDDESFTLVKDFKAD
jgi:hypothetical protein